MKLKVIMLLTLLAPVFQCLGQIPIHLNSGRIAGSGADYGDLIQSDSVGNIYTVGRFSGTCDIDPGPGIYSLTSSGTTDMYVAKFSATGTLIWAFNFGGLGTERPMAFKIDPFGRLYIAGDFSSAVDFDPGPGSTILTPAGGSDVYITRYTSDGNFISVSSFGGPNNDYSETMAFFSNGDFVLGGEFASPSIDIDPGAGTTTLNNASTSTTSFDPYLVRFDSSGTFLWAFSLPGAGSDYMKSLAIDQSGDIVTGGYFSQTLTTHPTGGLTLTTAGAADCFIAQYDGSGNHVNSWSFGGGGTDNLFAITCNNGTIYSSGTFNSVADLAPGPDTAFVSSRGLTDVFLNAITFSGTVVFAGGFGGSTSDFSFNLLSTSAGDVIVSGSFVDSADFDLSAGVQNVYAYGDRDGYCAKYGPTGNLKWAMKLGSGLIDYVRGLALAPNDEFLCTGYYGAANFYVDPLNLATVLTSVGSSDAFFARYSECAYPIFSSQPTNGGTCTGGNTGFNISASGQNPTYQWQEGTNGGTVWTNIVNGGVYSGATTPNLSLTGLNTTFNNRFYRCVVSVDCGLSSTSGVGILFVGSPDTTVSVNGITLNGVNVPGATYQWLDCGNGFAPISGATSFSYTPTTNGNYALQITRNGCSDTSSCYTVSSVGIDEVSASGMAVYPIPARDRVFICMENAGNYEVVLNDLSGKLVVASQRFTRTTEINIEHISSGTYILTVKNDLGGESTRRIVKE